jgi:hypothetical protein
MSSEIERLQGRLDQAMAILTDVRSKLADLSRPAEETAFERAGPARRFTFRWPNVRESYPEATAWTITSGSRAVEVKVGRTRRRAWDRNRRRWVVFGPAGPRSTAIYPWAEFVETDDGQMSAVVPDPEHPRRILREGDPVPPRYRGERLARADELFGSIANGASLRLVVDDEEHAVRHAYYVAGLKGRV